MFTLKFTLSHFFHQRKAKNRHGLHSPFVYRLVDEVIYDFSNKKVYTQIEKKAGLGKKLNSTDKLLYRITADNNPQTIWILGKYHATDYTILQQVCVNIQFKKTTDIADWKDATPPGVVFLDVQRNPQSAMDYFNRLLSKVHPHIVLIVKNIPENTLTKTSWSIMASHHKVTASVNLFWLGLMYFKPGQVKEDFLIKF
ncbi:hypothetical protein ACFQ3S_16730 [Mucilaginibacter terrae]|uniref:hypothetical protein n=1 Tax=Mucilaginibacter terrae TaxID=1955052 RepID=UPI003642A0BF